MSDRRDDAQLRRAKQGDQTALAALIAAFMPKIRRVARSAVCAGLDFEDAVQEGYLGLFYAVRSYSSPHRRLLSSLPANSVHGYTTPAPHCNPSFSDGG